MKFECEGGPKRDIDICIDVEAVPVHCGEERAQCKLEAVSFPVHLCYYQKADVANSSDLVSH